MASSYLHLRLSVLQFLQFFIWGSWFVTAGTYLLKQLEFTGSQVGWVYGTTAIAASITPFFVGNLADRFFSSEKLLAYFHLIGGGLLFYLAQIQSFPLFYAIVLIYFLCYLPTFSLSNALCMRHLEDVKNDFPKVRVWGTIAWILAGLLVSWLKIESEVLPIQIAAACSVIHGFYCFTLPKTPPLDKQESVSFLQSLSHPDVKLLLQDKSFVILLLSLFFVAFPMSYYYSFVNPFLNEMGVSNAAAKMTIGQITEIVFMLAMPFFFARMSFKSILFWGLLAWGVRYGLLVYGIHWQSEFLYIVAIALHGLAYIFSMFSAQIYIDSKVPAHLRNTAQGFYTLLTLGVGAFIGAFIAGETVSFYTLDNGLYNWVSIWWVPTYMGIAIAIAFYLLFKQKGKAY